MQGPLPHLASWDLQFLFSPVCFSPENLRVGRGLFSPQRCEQAEGEEVVAEALRGFSRNALNICLPHPRTASVLCIADHLFLMGWEERWPGSQGLFSRVVLPLTECHPGKTPLRLRTSSPWSVKGG